MQPTETTKEDSPAGVVPTPRSSAPWRVVKVHPKPGFRLDVTFADGTTGEVRLQGFLDSAAVDDTVFAPLRDSAVFAEASTELGAVAWPNGADLAPDAMYDAIRADGHWTVEA